MLSVFDLNGRELTWQRYGLRKYEFLADGRSAATFQYVGLVSSDVLATALEGSWHFKRQPFDSFELQLGTWSVSAVNGAAPSTAVFRHWGWRRGWRLTTEHDGEFHWRQPWWSSAGSFRTSDGREIVRAGKMFLSVSPHAESRKAVPLLVACALHDLLGRLIIDPD